MYLPNSSLISIFTLFIGIGMLFGAIIQYSALVNRIAGKISNSVMSNWKGKGIVKRHNGSPHQERSRKQQETRGNFSDLAGEYYSLTASQKELWKAYSVLLKGALTPLNAYVAANARLLQIFPAASRLVGPPPSPATPSFLKNISVVALAAGDFCVNFTSPTNTTLFAVIDYSPMPGLDSTTSPKWTFGGSTSCDSLMKTIALAYPAGTIVKFRARSMDSYARVSPWSQVIQAVSL